MGFTTNFLSMRREQGKLCISIFGIYNYNMKGKDNMVGNEINKYISIPSQYLVAIVSWIFGCPNLWPDFDHLENKS